MPSIDKNVQNRIHIIWLYELRAQYKINKLEVLTSNLFSYRCHNI